MFIKNDSSGEHRFYNGKIGLVTSVSKDGIMVRGNGDDESFLLETEEWTNSKYTLNPETKEITEEVEGRFRQYPSVWHGLLRFIKARDLLLNGLLSMPMLHLRTGRCMLR